jgi:hypothetical protein
MPYLYEQYELQILGDWTHTGSQTAGTTWKPTAQTGRAELDSNEVAEVVFCEIFPPFASDGTPENLEKIIFVLDDKPYGDYIHLLGTATHLFCPPKVQAMNGVLLAFGVPLIQAVKSGNPLYEGVCPKYTKTLKIETTAGTGGITGDYRIRVWGYRYPAQELDRLFGQIGGLLTLRDDRTNRVVRLQKDPVTVMWETWTQLPGGLDQAPPKIFPVVKYARNANATTPNTPYQFRYEIGNVAYREEDLYWPYDIEEKILVIKGLGVRAPANLKETFINIEGKDRPKKRFPTEQYNNPLHFGKAYPFLPDTIPLYFTIPKLDRPYLVWHDKGYIACQDNGNSIAQNAITVVMNGLLIEIGALPRGVA